MVRVRWEWWAQSSLETIPVGDVRGADLSVDGAGELTGGKAGSPEECHGRLTPSIVTFVEHLLGEVRAESTFRVRGHFRVLLSGHQGGEFGVMARLRFSLVPGL